MIARVLYILTLNSELYLLIVEIYSEECIPCKCEGVGLDLSTLRTGIKSKVALGLPYPMVYTLGFGSLLHAGTIFRDDTLNLCPRLEVASRTVNRSTQPRIVSSTEGSSWFDRNQKTNESDSRHKVGEKSEKIRLFISYHENTGLEEGLKFLSRRMHLCCDDKRRQRVSATSLITA